jgi:hypothetical protein
MEAIGFTAVTLEYEHLHFQQNLSAWIEIVRRRDTCSQLLAIPDTAYEAGIRRLEREVDEETVPLSARIISVCRPLGARNRTLARRDSTTVWSALMADNVVGASHDPSPFRCAQCGDRDGGAMPARLSATHGFMRLTLEALHTGQVHRPRESRVAPTLHSIEQTSRPIRRPELRARRVLSQHAGAAHAKQKKIRTKPLRSHDSKCGKQAKTGGRRWVGNNLRHQRAPSADEPRILFMICSLQGQDRLAGR